MQTLIRSKRGLDKNGEAIMPMIIQDLQQPLDAINAIIEKYELVEPEKNIKPMWLKGRFTLGFDYKGLPLSPNASK